MARYEARAGTYTGHCCIKAWVVDTHAEDDAQMVAECFTVGRAEHIAMMLNAADGLREPVIDLAKSTIEGGWIGSTKDGKSLKVM